MQSRVFTILFVCIFSCDAAKILAVVPTPSYSHQVAFIPIWKELSRRGHQVTLITTNPIKDSSFTNLTEIDISFCYDVLHAFNYHDRIFNMGNDFVALLKFFMLVWEELEARVFEMTEIQNLLQNPNLTYDVVIVEYLHPLFYAFAHKFNAPLIGVLSLDSSYIGHDCLGNPSHPVLNPDVFIQSQYELNFGQRISSTLQSIFLRMYYRYLMNTTTKAVKKYFGEGYPATEDMVCSVDMLFTNVNPLLDQIRPVVPAYVAIGGGLHLRKPKPLPKDLQEYLDNAKEGVVYFSLGGTNVQSKMIPQQLRQTVMDTFAELPYKVLWKFEEDELPGKPDNVKIAKWLPQQDVLRHPNIKLFVTQGGIQSMEEAIFSHVPMVGMPFFADQQNNVQKMTYKGLGLQVDRENLDKDTFKNAIMEVITNPKYKERVKEIAELSLDQPMTGLEKAIWWTEYVIRHKGAKHLKGPAADLPLYQYFLLDVIGFCVVVLAILIFIIVKTIKISIKIVKKLFSKKKEKTT